MSTCSIFASSRYSSLDRPTNEELRMEKLRREEYENALAEHESPVERYPGLPDEEDVPDADDDADGYGQYFYD